MHTLAQTRIRAEREGIVVIYRIAVLRVDALDEGAVVLEFIDADVAADPRHVVVGRDLVERAPAALLNVLFRCAAAFRLRPLAPAVVACVKIKISRRVRVDLRRDAYLVGGSTLVVARAEARVLALW